ncbi:NAD-dependent succinate-semialdehyde dehydrogenase [Marinobacterium jannaschii]|uniref:NAD-dependent succinate-semialdehyde dehydrogenase n=1 Tax=Marinobacterium jannaschii TaxID=64970 RepID=UPI00047F5BCD|nr:NAD-dependent succinate-semialdehyde dehydrogenase [Marinobacterium jannaschii]
MFETRNPATGELIQQFDYISDTQLDAALARSEQAARAWRKTDFAERSQLLHKVAALLTERREALARTVSLEMGKLLGEALGEVDKCAGACAYYADHGAAMLQDKLIETPAKKSLVAFEPIGTVLAIMPWNFPLWQVIRCMAPTLMAGNTLLLKHAPNVPQCALALEEILRDAGAPEGVFSSLLISVEQSATVIADRRVHGVAFTGSEVAGRKIGALAGANLKKVVLELGGSDPLIVLDDADLDQAVEIAVRARFSNAGQICIAAKRFIVTEAVADEFVSKLMDQVATLKCGDPTDADTRLAPMTREDLRTQVHQQVLKSIEQGATPLAGCEPLTGHGWFYPASVLDNVKPGMEAFDEELFGPVASIVRVKDEAEAIAMANNTRFGLGASLFTRDAERGEQLARQIEAGAVFVNAQVGSDVRLPFGGIKCSGVGRELASYGMHEFCNIKTLWVGE